VFQILGAKTRKAHEPESRLWRGTMVLQEVGKTRWIASSELVAGENVFP